jgi:DNA-binding Lrp family transcriptional regulator
MEPTIRERILDLLEGEAINGKHALTSEEIADELDLTKRQVQEANTKLKKQKKIKGDGLRPCRFSLNKRYKGRQQSVSTNKSVKRVNNVSSSFKFNQFLILYITDDSPTPKMLHDFNDVKELTAKFEELQKLENLVDIAAFRKLGTTKKIELKF